MNIETLAKRYSNLPADWKVVPLGDVLANIIGGGTPSRNDATYWGGDIPWLTVKDMRSRRPADAQEHITARAVAESATSIIPADTVITATRVGLGKVVRVPFPATINQDLKALIVRPELDKSYLEYWIVSIATFLESIGSGTTVKGIRLETLRQLPFPLAPLKQQQEIVAEIEKQFSRLDEAVVNLKRVKANLKRYKASVLKDAVEGRLVPTEAELARREGRSFETGEQLLLRILEARRSTWKGKYDSPTPPVCPVDVEIPKGWTWVTVSQAMRERIVNGLSIKESQIPTEVRALRLSAMSDQGLDFDDFRCLPIDPEKVEDIVIRESDFFVSRGNGSLELVGRGSPAQKPKKAIIFPDTMMRIRFTKVASVGPWFHALWSTRLVRRQIEKRVKTTAGIYKMAQPELASITIPLPPLAEQSRIVAEVDRRLSLVRGVEAEVDANLKRAQALRQATLSKAFVGDKRS